MNTHSIHNSIWSVPRTSEDYPGSSTRVQCESDFAFGKTIPLLRQRLPTLSSVQQRDAQDLRASGNSKAQGLAVQGQGFEVDKGAVNSTISKDETGDAKVKEYKLLARFDKNVHSRDDQPEQSSPLEAVTTGDSGLSNLPSPPPAPPFLDTQSALPHNEGLGGVPIPESGNDALQDYQMQLMLLEQQNKKRLLFARQGQDDLFHSSATKIVGMPPPYEPQTSLSQNRLGSALNAAHSEMPQQHYTMFSPLETSQQASKHDSYQASQPAAKILSQDDSSLDHNGGQSTFDICSKSNRSFLPQRIAPSPSEETSQKREPNLNRIGFRSHNSGPGFSSSKAKSRRLTEVSDSLNKAVNGTMEPPYPTQTTSIPIRKVGPTSSVNTRPTTLIRRKQVKTQRDKDLESYLRQLDGMAHANMMRLQRHSVTAPRPGSNPKRKVNTLAAKPSKQDSSQSTSIGQTSRDEISDVGSCRSANTLLTSAATHAKNTTIKVDDANQIAGSPSPQISDTPIDNSDNITPKEVQFSFDTLGQTPGSRSETQTHTALPRHLVPMDVLDQLGCPYEVDQVIAKWLR